MKSRIELKMQAQELFLKNWLLLVISAAILWVVSSIQGQISQFMPVPEESIAFAAATPGLETLAENWANLPDPGLAMWQVSLAVLLIGFLWAMLSYGFSSLALRAVKKEELPELEIFSAYRNFGRWAIFYLLYTIKVLLWSMLFIVPGIIAMLNYSQAVYLLIEDEDLRPNEALKKSTLLMRGRQFEFFIIWLSFIGFHLLAAFSWGISTLYSTPYIRMTYAGYYCELIANQSSSAASGIVAGDATRASAPGVTSTDPKTSIDAAAKDCSSVSRID